ncbi:MAG: hypothetical protein L0H37_07180 [Nitrosospira sp.]|nr:hypothetical protein [Nitrosospira sp.]
MTLPIHIEQVRQKLRRGEYQSEAAVSQGIVLPALHGLGWPVFDTSVVIPEYALEGRRVDYALCHPAHRPSVFIEVKKVGHSDGADQQLFEYAFHLGVPIAILTDGQEWSFYLPGEQERYDERRVYKLDLLERTIEESITRLERYLGFDNVCSHKALESARSDYKNVARDREIKSTFPKAWRTLLEEPDSLLVDLLAEKIEDLCGYKPDLDACSHYLTAVAARPDSESLLSGNQSKPLPANHNDLRATRTRAQRKRQPFSFEFDGRTYQAKSAKEVMVKVFRLLAEVDADFLERFASRKHGRKRRYLAREKSELYPGRPDLCAECSVEVVPGWWLGTNYSRNNIQDILDLALEVAPASFQSKIRVSVK